MSGGPFHPGNVYRVHLPDSVGHEMRDNPAGPRPWVILHSAGHKESGLVIAAPIASNHGPGVLIVPFEPDWFVSSQSSDTLSHGGWVHLTQLRAVSKERFDLSSGPIGRFESHFVDRLRDNIAATFDSSRMNRRSG